MDLDWLSDHLEYFAVSSFLGLAYWQITKNKRQQKAARKVLQKAIDTQMNEPLTLHPEINPALCAGCGNCTQVCPEGDILRLIDHKAVLVSPTKCVGHGECEAACPTGAISLVFGTKVRGMDIPRISSNYETNVPGLYIVGELGGMGLIRNAVKQGHLGTEHAVSELKKSAGGNADTDILIVGAGPAGLAAALTAIMHGRSYRCLEQGGFGGTVYQFPRQKVVMSHPAELPGIGTMKFAKNKVSKEELLEYWNGIRKKTGLKVDENTRFESLAKGSDGIFTVKTNKGEIRARKVLLAMGVRGSPRKLGLPNEDLPKVTYNLLDPEQYQRMSVAVVGGGNAGVEAAQYLAKKEYGNKVDLLVRGPTFDRCNDENKEIIQRMEREGLVKIRYETSVKAIEKDKIILNTKEGELPIPNDYLFIFAGAESPHKFLMSLGIKIEKKFGEALK